MGKPTLEDVREGTALLNIRTTTKAGVVDTTYWVWQTQSGIFLLEKFNGEEVYTVHNGTCTCPDADRGNDCKHARALRAAITKLQEKESGSNPTVSA